MGRLRQAKARKQEADKKKEWEGGIDMMYDKVQQRQQREKVQERRRKKANETSGETTRQGQQWEKIAEGGGLVKLPAIQGKKRKDWEGKERVSKKRRSKEREEDGQVEEITEGNMNLWKGRIPV
eukprot:gb/GEZN01023792.1/.p1 GENE.gb/GEZN01023792.1/~~gb/GEZN01023792.1/.p1  ORF type:complete len:124 (+),score=31.79 gb/GEZN01023792.1/:204-575(+)